MDRPEPQEEKKQNLLDEAKELRSDLLGILSIVRSPTVVAESGNKVPEPSIKLDQLKTIILDCKDIAASISKSLTLLV